MVILHARRPFTLTLIAVFGQRNDTQEMGFGLKKTAQKENGCFMFNSFLFEVFEYDNSSVGLIKLSKSRSKAYKSLIIFLNLKPLKR